MNNKGNGKICFDDSFAGKIANNFGYTPEIAIEELIDNSIAAHATEISITCRNNKLVIVDSGIDAGMDLNTLKNNFFCNGCSSANAIDDDVPGMFGIGGKLGILNLIGKNGASTVRIDTHKKNNKSIHANWKTSPTNYTEYDYEEFDSCDDSYGTKIEFDYNVNINVDSLIKTLSVVYFAWLEAGLRITVNKMPVLACDPLYRTNEIVKAGAYRKTKTFTVKDLGANITVDCVGFYSDMLPQEEIHDLDAGVGRAKSIMTSNRSGIYLRTGNRLYTLGGNFAQAFGKQNHTDYNGLRFEITIPKIMWERIGVEINKDTHIANLTEIKEFVDNKIVDFLLICAKEFREKKVSKNKDSNKRLKKFNKFSEKLKLKNITCKIENSTKQAEFAKFDIDKSKIIFNIYSKNEKDDKILQNTIKINCTLIDRFINEDNSAAIIVILEELNNG